ncbi:MAG: hypothetical protein GY749_06000 [Desulfobacteraceae bacterium]|nr:hypothetical protein [Desulfobacteraceae bacterium]
MTSSAEAAEAVKFITTLTSDEETEVKKYNHIDLEIYQAEDRISSATCPNDSAHTGITPKYTYKNRDKILNELEGVVDRVNEVTVRVKLFPDNYVNFPYIIFEEPTEIKQGQHIKYMIKEDTEGYRYQQIVLIENKQAHPEKDMILSLLDEFKYKDE